MATRVYGIDPGAQNTDVAEAIGSAASSGFIALTVDIANTVVTEGGGTRTLTREELINGLENIKEHIMRGDWPPA